MSELSKNARRKKRRYSQPEPRQGIGGMGERRVFSELSEGHTVYVDGKKIAAWHF